MEDKEAPSYFDGVLNDAIEIFWATIAQSYPEAKTGDVDPDGVQYFAEAASRSVNRWLAINIPKANHQTDKDCERYLSDFHCMVCGVAHDCEPCYCGGHGFHNEGCQFSDSYPITAFAPKED